ncbi:MAG TPA: GIY-YIG nuclease family protein [Candidatus Omnitrophota bacterium]|nr:GIY-YIG nuclease family protein [Candidatus Omnitrophota bacterium]
MDNQWSVYIIECRTKDLYIGIAQDVNKRVELHNQGRACRYTKFRRPVQLKYVEVSGSYTDARKRERQIKKYSRFKKLALMEHV